MCLGAVLILKFRRWIIREAGLSPPLDDDEQLTVSLLCSFASYAPTRFAHVCLIRIGTPVPFPISLVESSQSLLVEHLHLAPTSWGYQRTLTVSIMCLV